jgi:hypothetical protein
VKTKLLFVLVHGECCSTDFDELMTSLGKLFKINSSFSLLAQRLTHKNVIILQKNISKFDEMKNKFLHTF